MTTTVPFLYLAHLVTVPVCVGDTEFRFIVDTGIGVNLVSDSLARALGCAPTGSVFTGRRMSGQEVTAPLISLDSVRLGDRRSRDVPAAIFDMGAMAGLDGIGGFLSLQFSGRRRSRSTTRPRSWCWRTSSRWPAGLSPASP